MRQFQRTSLSIAAAQVALTWSAAAFAQAPAPSAPAAAASASAPAEKSQVIVISGQRAAIQSAQKIKQDSDEIVDSIVAEDIGKLPDRSVTEVLQRIVGVTIDRTMSRKDPEHFSVEGSGVNVRGLTYVRSELNGRDSFSANGGRALSFEDVPPELLSAVDVYKNPSAEQIEGAIGGLVNLRTALPFDYKGFKFGLTAQVSQSQLRKKKSPGVSGLISNTWDTEAGKFGALLDLARSKSSTRTDYLQVEPYYARKGADSSLAADQLTWIPKGAAWRTLDFDRTRDGLYGALQWKKDNVESSLTYFRSKYKMYWDESAIFSQVDNPYNVTVDPGATYDASGALLTGTLRAPADGGLNFGSDTRFSDRTSLTQDLSWNVKWKASNRWSFSSDLQLVRATTQAFDSTVATGVRLPKQTVDLRGSEPHLSFDDSDTAYLQNPANYYWAFTMEHKDKSVASQKAWRGDATLRFDDPVLRDLRFGVRLVDRDATTTNTVPGYNWSAITQTWQVGSAAWQPLNTLAYLADPRFAGGAYQHVYDNFFNGKVNVPSLWLPTFDAAAGYPDSYAALHKYFEVLCKEKDPTANCSAWTPASFGTDPAGTNAQKERNASVYGQLRFGFDDLKVPVDGNVGLRLVRTKATADGYLVLKPSDKLLPGVPLMAPIKEAQGYENTYTSVLPSLNLKMLASKDLQFRVAMSRSLSQPEFSQLQAFYQLSQNVNTNADGSLKDITYTGTSSGNPLLKPVKSDNIDATVEWYFGRASSVTLAVFNKRLTDIIINQSFIKSLPDAAGVQRDFVVTGPVNGAKGRAQGFELAYQQYFDKLPGWLAGLGMQANYTFVDSRQTLKNPVNQTVCAGSNTADNFTLNLNGCDTNGQVFGNLPLNNLSKHSYNLALLYDRGPLSARIAYSWRSKYLQAVNVNGTQGGDASLPTDANYGRASSSVAWGLPVWSDAYGQIDAGVNYKLTDNLSISLEGINLTDKVAHQLMQQGIGFKTRAGFATGRVYAAKLSYNF